MLAQPFLWAKQYSNSQLWAHIRITRELVKISIVQVDTLTN